MIDAGFTQMKQKNAREVTLRAIEQSENTQHRYI